jgi:acyl-CoA synthetase (AMP-forming)/AMP-acid ligase II
MPSEPDEHDPVILMYTGGTTGLPKGVLLEQRAEVLNVYHVGLAIGLSEERRFLFQSPMFHAAVVAGVLGIPASGATSVSIPLFDPELVLDTVETHHIATTMTVPVMMSLLEQHGSFAPQRLACLRQIVYGAAPISASMLRRWYRCSLTLSFYQGYGMSEAASVLIFLGPREHGADVNSLTAAAHPPLVSNFASLTRWATRWHVGSRGKYAPEVATSCVATGASPKRQRRSCETGGTTRATWVTSMNGASCI